MSSTIFSTSTAFASSFPVSSSRLAHDRASVVQASRLHQRRSQVTYLSLPKPPRVVSKVSLELTGSMTMKKFWDYADEARVSTQYNSDRKISFLRHASFEEIKKVCIQYRYFVERYPSYLCWLISKLPDGELRSLMAEILAEELGSGKKQAAHIVWYDNFLRSLGISEEEINESIYPENAQILSEIENRCHQKPHEYVIGMVGMGGECLCQLYLTTMYKYLSENEAVKEMSKDIDWTFWTYHIGEEDIKHREMVRAAIDGATADGAGAQELFLGYSWGKGTWDRFWANNYKETRVVI